MFLLTFIIPFALLLVGFVVSVAAGADSEAEVVAPGRTLVALLIAAAILVLQAVLWVRLGTLL